MTIFTERLENLAAASGGTILSGTPDLAVSGLFSDTRAPVRGGMFIALRGDRFDGNSFAREAIENLGAAAVLVDRPEAVLTLPARAGAILVQDTRAGYLGIAASHRNKLSSTAWFGITGSVGKSTTKELLAYILEHAGGWSVHKAQGSFNNAVGVSQTILGANAQHRAVVLEIGTNHPGEIRQLASVARLNIAVITCAAESHLEAFETLENVAREKAEILAFQGSDDTAVLNADDPHFQLWRKLAAGRVVSFGRGEKATLCAKYVRLDAKGRAKFMLRCGDSIAECALQVPGLHQVSNVLAAIAAALSAGISLPAAALAASHFEGIARRFAVTESRGITIIDDAYNANPASFRAALQTLKATPAARRIVVAGDMLELGAHAERCHHDLGLALAEQDLAALATVGEMAGTAGSWAVQYGLPPERWFRCFTPEQAAKSIRPLLREGDAVLIKGSHSVRLEKCCEVLLSPE